MEKKKKAKRSNAGRPAKLKDPMIKMIKIEAAMDKEIKKRFPVFSDFAREAIARRLEEGW